MSVTFIAIGEPLARAIEAAEQLASEGWQRYRVDEATATLQPNQVMILTHPTEQE